MKNTLAILLIIIISPVVWATETPFIDPGVRLKQQEKLQQQLDLKLDSNLDLNIPISAPNSTEDNACFSISNIKVFSDSLKSKYLKFPWLKNYYNTCLSTSTLTEIIFKINQELTQKGFFQAMAYISPQDLSDGSLEIEIIPARLEKVIVKDKAKKYKPLLWANLPLKKGQVLTFSSLEDATDSLNHLQSIETRIIPAPGTEKGKTIIYADIHEEDRLRGYGGFDNQGQNFTGLYRVSPSIQLDNLFRIGDSWSLSYLGNEDTDALIASTSLPLRPKWTLNANYIYSNFLTSLQISPETPPLDLYGRFESYDVSINKQLFRNKNWQISAGGGFVSKSSSREIDGFPLDNQHTRAIYTNNNFIKRSKTRALSFGSSLYWGTPYFGATKIAKNGRDDIPDGRFIRLEGFGQLYQNTKLGLISSNWNIQWAPMTTYGNEHLILGGLYSVRGYREAILSGEQGFLNRNELQIAVPESDNKIVKFTKKHIQPYVFYDQGLSKTAHQNSSNYLASIGAGMRFNFKLANFETSYGFPLVHNGSGRWHFNIRFKAF